MGHQNQIIIEKHGSVTLLDVKGDVTSASEPFFNDAYKRPDILEGSKIVLVFDEDAYINSGGLAVLIQLLAETKRNNQQIAITGLSDHFKKIFRMVGITKLATIFPSVNEAMKRFSSP
jgi:anti-anti-sigma factor